MQLRRHRSSRLWQKSSLNFEPLEARLPLALLAPLARLANDTGSSHTDSITSDGRLIVTAAKNAVVQFFVQPGEWVAAQPTPNEGLNTIFVRQTDATGRVSPSRRVHFTLDTTPPSAPTLSLRTDSGISAVDALTNNGTIAVGNPLPGESIAFRYVNDTILGNVSRARVQALLHTKAGGWKNGDYRVGATTYDTAGNSADAELRFTIDATPPAIPSVRLTHDTGRSSVDRLTSDGQIEITNTESGALVEYALPLGTWAALYPTPHEGLNTVRVRQTDTSGNTSPAAVFRFTIDSQPPRNPVVALVNDTGWNAHDAITSDGTLAIGRETGTDAAITSVDGTPAFLPIAAGKQQVFDTSALAWSNGIHSFGVTAYDAAGNTAAAEYSFELSIPGRPLTAMALPLPTTDPTNPYLVNVRDYGAVGDNSNDDSGAIHQAFVTSVLTGKPLYFPTGTYYVGTNQLKLTLEQARTTGVTMFGDGVGRSIINAADVTVSPQVLVTCPSVPGDQVFLSMKSMAFFTNTPGVGIQFGNEKFTDALNEPQIDLMVLNFNKTATAVAVEMNYVLNGEIRLVANTAAAGTSLLLRQASFSHFTGSYGGPGGVSVRLSDGFNDGNVFTALDMENVAVCVISNSPSNQANTFVGGTWSYSSHGIVSTAGARLVIINPGINPRLPGTALGFVGAKVGLVLFPAIL